MTDQSNSGNHSNRYRRSFYGALSGLALLQLVVFHQILDPAQVLFSNDAPLGVIHSDAGAAVESFSGFWQDLNWIGFPQPSASPTLSTGLSVLMGPVWYSKLYAPYSLFLLGIGCWFLFRQLGFPPMVCLLGALAAALNMNTFSNACWGLGSRALSLGSVMMTIAFLESSRGRYPILKMMLAGVSLGLAIMEGYDVGAIYSLFIGAYMVFSAFNSAEKSSGPRWGRFAKTAIIVVAMSAITSSHTLITLVKTQVQGVQGMEQDQKTKEEQWDPATQWSLPKIETLRVLIPGLFGYRMDAENGGNYWGKVGRSPAYELTGQGLPRHSGSGEYAGILVVLLAFWALCQSLRTSEGSPFSGRQKRNIQFWSGMALVALFLAFGRHAPFYKVLYQLPFFSTMRNPIKFMHPFHLCVIILFGYGLFGIWKSYIIKLSDSDLPLKKHLQHWWKERITPFDKKWTIGCCIVWIASLVCWLLYGSSNNELLRHLKQNGFSETAGFSNEFVQSIRMFSIVEIGWYLLFFLLSLGGLTAILSGFFSGNRSRWAVGLLALILVCDLVRADTHWILSYNYRQKYASNSVVEILRDKPYERRVTALKQEPNLYILYRSEWLQHLFQYYNISSSDYTQMPRWHSLDLAFASAFSPDDPKQYHLRGKFWQLTSTRYILGVRGLLDTLNNQLDPTAKRFKVHSPFNFQKKTDGSYDTLIETNGQFALFEFEGALPRTRLFNEWIVETENEATLKKLSAPSFDPLNTLVVNETIDLPQNVTSINKEDEEINGGSAVITNYRPKRVEVETSSSSPSVLLLNDKYSSDWKVQVDGNEQTLLRCNYLMMGVEVGAGTHTVVFEYKPQSYGLPISLVSVIFGILTVVYLGKDHRKTE